jgi:hypothetical protein
MKPNMTFEFDRIAQINLVDLRFSNFQMIEIEIYLLYYMQYF